MVKPTKHTYSWNQSLKYLRSLICKGRQWFYPDTGKHFTWLFQYVVELINKRYNSEVMQYQVKTYHSRFCLETYASVVADSSALSSL